MRILYDINHPAHVHYARPLLAAFAEQGHLCRVTARDKDVTVALLQQAGIEHTVLSRPGRGRLGQLRELLVREARFLSVAARFRPDLIMGTTVHAGRVGALVGARSLVLNEDDLSVVPLFCRLAYPLATAVATPDCLAHERHGRRHLTYASYQKLLYLHPNRFAPDPRVRAAMGVPEGVGYGLVRLSALEAHHDAGVRGISARLVEDVERLAAARGLRLFVSGERCLPEGLRRLQLGLPPERMHDALALAEFFVGDSQSMTVEAAVLGTPAFQINDLFGRITVVRQLAGYGLCRGYRPGQETGLLADLGEQLAGADRRRPHDERRQRMLGDKIDPVPWMVETALRIGAGG